MTLWCNPAEAMSFATPQRVGVVGGFAPGSCSVDTEDVGAKNVIDILEELIKGRGVRYVQLVGSVDQRPVGPKNSCQVADNRGLSKGRAENVEKWIRQGLADRDLVASGIRFVHAASGPINTRQDGSVKAELERDRAVVVYAGVLDGPGRH